MKRDGRKMDHGTLEEIRKMAMERVIKGKRPSTVIVNYGFHQTIIYRKRSICPTSVLSIALDEPSRIAATQYSDRQCPGMSGWQRRRKCRCAQIMMPAVCSPVVAGRSETAAGP